MDNRALLGRLYNLHGEKLRYLVVGVCNTAFGYLLFAIALALCTPLKALADSPIWLAALVGRNYFLIAQWTSWVFGVPVGTTTMKFFVFRSKGRWLHEVRRAYFVYFPGLAISSLILWLTVRILHLPPLLGQLITIVVATIFSYLGHKYFTFSVQPAVGDGMPADGPTERAGDLRD